ncbi:MAG: hypothetical protein B6229_02105 [Spirochaetaceae bacterium 4572_7]|nr:MAG: hypothetical protein B6229_02105 [Spirochaetaceae bacterium 4572_7]
MNKQWYKESVFYHIYPLGFTGAPESNNFAQEPVSRLNKVEEWIPHIKSLGVNAIYLGPLFESSTHGYDTVDYYKVDRRLGTNDTLKKLIQKLHENQIKVVLDGVFNHVSRDFFAFKDLLEKKKESKYINWFSGVDFNYSSPMGDDFTYNSWSGHYNLVQLNLKNSEVVDYLFGAIKMWADDLGIDGLRLDVALFSSHNDNNYYEIAHSLKRLFNSDSGIYRDMKLYNFVDNHDVNRIGSTLTDSRHLYPLHILLYTIPGIPSIYYGSEWGIGGVKDNSDKAIRPDLEITHMGNSSNNDLVKTIKQLSNLWLNSDSLKHGSYREILVDSQQLLFLREYNGEKVLVAVNSNHDPVNISIDSSYIGGKFVDILNEDVECFSQNDKLNIEIPGCWGRVLKVV